MFNWWLQLTFKLDMYVKVCFYFYKLNMLKNIYYKYNKYIYNICLIVETLLYEKNMLTNWEILIVFL